MATYRSDVKHRVLDAASLTKQQLVQLVNDLVSICYQGREGWDRHKDAGYDQLCGIVEALWQAGFEPERASGHDCYCAGCACSREGTLPSADGDWLCGECQRDHMAAPL